MRLAAISVAAVVGSLVTGWAMNELSAQQPPAATAARRGDVERPAQATIARTEDGKPDLRGVWTAPTLFNSNILEDHPAGYGIDAGRTVVIDPPDGTLPYHPWALAQRDENRKAENAYLDNQGRCILSGVPRIMQFSFEVQYAANDIVLVSDYVNTTRIIHMDRRTHIPGGITLWLGDSVGYWENDTLVVDTANFNGKFWFALGGDFATGALRIVERFNLSDANTLQWQATITDPNVFTRPWTWRWNEPYKRGKVEEQDASNCHEGNVYLAHLKGTHDKYRAAIAAGKPAGPVRPAVVPTGPGRLTGRWILNEAFDEDGRPNRRPPFASQVLINHTSDRLQVEASASRQDTIYVEYRVDGSETRMESSPGVTDVARVSSEGEKTLITTRRTFPSPAGGEVVVDYRELYSVNNDTLTVERDEVIDNERTSAKAIYRKAQ